MTTTETPATYVFCVVQSPRRPSLAGIVESIPGAGAPRVLAIDRDLWAIVADAPLERFSSDRLEQEMQDLEAVSRHALAHASVIESVFRKAPVIPLKLFTLFTADERVQHELSRRAAALREVLARLRGHEEWGVRITVSPEDGARSRGGAATGTGYLLEKKRVLDRAGAPPKSAMKEARAALKRLDRMSATSRPQVFPAAAPNQPFVMGASFLVPAKKRAMWKREISSIAASLDARGHRLDASGPWPPYHFSSANT